jgi:prepilin-type N-terminal cleavage/methylation domain-containing protein
MRPKKAFTLIELLVVIGIIGILATIGTAVFNNSRQKARDLRRVHDIKSIQTALTAYYTAENRYPNSLTAGQPLMGSTSSTTYMAVIPDAPTPADGDCADFNNYSYLSVNNGKSYELSFCLGGTMESINPGCNFATPSEIENRDYPLCVSDLKLWLESDLGVELNGGDVSTWADQSGLGNDATQTTPANQPLLVSGYQNGHAAVKFDGATTFMNGTTISGFSTSSLSIFIVAAGENSANT